MELEKNRLYITSVLQQLGVGLWQCNGILLKAPRFAPATLSIINYAISLVMPTNYDIKELVIPVLGHRIVCRGSFSAGQRRKAAEILNAILESVAVPL